jgi:hypothetical protein
MPNGSNSAAMRASGRIKRGQDSQSIEPSRRTKVADLQSPHLLGSERAKWSSGNPHKSQGERENRTDECGWQSQDVNKRLKLLVGA